MPLTCMLTTEHLRLEIVSMPGILWEIAPPQSRQEIVGALPREVVGVTTGAFDSTRQWKEAVVNQLPIPQLQVGPYFKLRLSMDMSEDITGEAVSLTDYNRLLCMSYHLKGFCNLNCIG